MFRLCLVAVYESEVLQLLQERRQELCSNDDQTVTAALLELVAASLDASPASPLLLPVCLHRSFLSLLLRSLAAPPSYHIGDLATQCLSLLLESLTINADDIVSGRVNYRKLRNNLLVEYFDTVTDKRTLLAQLKRMVKNARSHEVRRLMVDFIAAKVDMTFLPLAPVDFCSIVLDTAGWEEGEEKEEGVGDLYGKLLRVQDPSLKLILVFEMCKRLEERPHLAIFIIGIYSTVVN